MDKNWNDVKKPDESKFKKIINIKLFALFEKKNRKANHEREPFIGINWEESSKLKILQKIKHYIIIYWNFYSLSCCNEQKRTLDMILDIGKLQKKIMFEENKLRWAVMMFVTWCATDSIDHRTVMVNIWFHGCHGVDKCLGISHFKKWCINVSDETTDACKTSFQAFF